MGGKLRGYKRWCGENERAVTIFFAKKRLGKSFLNLVAIFIYLSCRNGKILQKEYYRGWVVVRILHLWLKQVLFLFLHGLLIFCSELSKNVLKLFMMHYTHLFVSIKTIRWNRPLRYVSYYTIYFLLGKLGHFLIFLIF